MISSCLECCAYNAKAASSSLTGSHDCSMCMARRCCVVSMLMGNLLVHGQDVLVVAATLGHSWFRGLGKGRKNGRVQGLRSKECGPASVVEGNDVGEMAAQVSPAVRPYQLRGTSKLSWLECYAHDAKVISSSLTGSHVCSVCMAAQVSPAVRPHQLRGHQEQQVPAVPPGGAGQAGVQQLQEG